MGTLNEAMATKRAMNCVYSRQDNREILGSDEDSRSAKLFVYIRKDKGVFSIHTFSYRR